MDSVTVAVLDCFSPNIAGKLLSKLPRGWTLLPIGRTTFKERKTAIKNATAALVMGAPLNERLLVEADNLLYIQKLGAGVDNIDLNYCREHKIGVGRLNAGNAIPVAEHTLMMMLAASRQLVNFDKSTRAGSWQKEIARGSNQSVHGKTVGIVGLGAIGRQVAKLLCPFGVRLLYCDPVPAPQKLHRTLNLKKVDLDQILKLSDIITLHCPLNANTRNLIDKKAVKNIKKGAIIINCARGGLIDETAIVAALKAGQLFSVGLDTFSKEPPDNASLLELENTVLSPHCAGATLDNFDDIAERAITNIKLFLRDKTIPRGDIVYDPR